jgi:hypothetical protein
MSYYQKCENAQRMTVMVGLSDADGHWHIADWSTCHCHCILLLFSGE